MDVRDKLSNLRERATSKASGRAERTRAQRERLKRRVQNADREDVRRVIRKAGSTTAKLGNQLDGVRQAASSGDDATDMFDRASNATQMGAPVFDATLDPVTAPHEMEYVASGSAGASSGHNPGGSRGEDATPESDPFDFGGFDLDRMVTGHHGGDGDGQDMEGPLDFDTGGIEFGGHGEEGKTGSGTDADGASDGNWLEFDSEFV